MENYIFAGYKSWHKKIFEEKILKYPGNWHLISAKEQLTKKKLDKIKPKYVFFMHWSWMVPKEIVGNYECVCFHMSDVPYGRGGSPLQNLILRDHKTTKLTALRMEQNLDSGPVYLKGSLSLKGNAEDIYIRATDLGAKMILKIIRRNMKPEPQKGKVVIFKRRKPQESLIPADLTLEKTYDFIRMLDAEGYPKAFLKNGNIIYELSGAVMKNNKIFCSVKIKKNEK